MKIWRNKSLIIVIEVFLNLFQINLISVILLIVLCEDNKSNIYIFINYYLYINIIYFLIIYLYY